MEKDLGSIREELDKLDKELLALFMRRMELSRDVAAVKKSSGKAVHDPKREEEKLEALSALAGEDMAPYARELYRGIFALSRRYQHAILKDSFGLIGERLNYSFSPRIHSMLSDYDYKLFELHPKELEGFLQSTELCGMNVTIPYKKAVLPCCTWLSDAVKRIGSANTLVRHADGWHAYNTDYFGFRRMVESAGTDVKGKKALILGSGGAMLSVRCALEDMGAGEIAVISRSGEDNYDNLNKHADAAILVNATPVGMYPDVERAPLSLDSLPALEAVFDLVYNPARTELIMQAEERGIVCRSGLYMLVAQAHRAAELFIDEEIPTERIDEIERILRGETENIVLIGMPGCGKSSVGRALAELTGRSFADADEKLRERFSMSAGEMINTYGEEHFRRCETQVLSELAKQSGLIIATGGGCVTREENYRHLHRNGRIFWLQRGTDKLPSEGRPLSLGGSLDEMYARREPMYRRFADCIIDNDSGSVIDSAGAILEAMK